MIFSQHDASQMRQAALQAGARGYVAKSDAVRDLLAAIEAVSQHLQPSSPEPGIHSSM
jgi:DNA-binding NarL/FixJ family response regulator